MSTVKLSLFNTVSLEPLAHLRVDITPFYLHSGFLPQREEERERKRERGREREEEREEGRERDLPYPPYPVCLP